MSTQKTTIIITGAHSLVGQNLLALCVSEYKVIALCPSADKIPKHLSHIAEWQVGSILDVVFLEEQFQQAQWVFHCDDYCSFLPSAQKKMYEINVKGTENVVNIALSVGIEKLMFLSSTFAFGTYQHKQTISEKTKWEENKQNNYYALSKNRAEMEVLRAKIEGLFVQIICPSIVVNDSIYKAISKSKVQLKGSNGFVTAPDLAKICLLLLKNEKNNGQKFIVNAFHSQYNKLFKQNHRKLHFIHQYTAPLKFWLNVFFQTKFRLPKEILNLNGKDFHFETEKFKQHYPNFSFSSLKS